jgi:hypothetical protein
VATRSASGALILLLWLAGPAGGQATGQAPSTSPSALPQVTIEADRQALDRQLHAFIAKVTGAPVGSGDYLELWEAPICLIVAGLPKGEFVFTRLTETFKSAGARLGRPGCQPNFYIIGTTRPEEVLASMRRRDPRVFRGAGMMEVKRFIDTPRPVRVWYNEELGNGDGDVSTPGPNTYSSLSPGSSMSGAMGAVASLGALPDVPTTEHGTASRLTENAVHNLTGVIEIVDMSRLEGVEWGALADYIAFIGLTNIRLDTDLGDMPTILRLFSARAELRPSSLSEWDTAFLKALYHTLHKSRNQRVQVVDQMLSEVSPAR